MLMKDILKLNLDLALATADDEDFFESNINSDFSENISSYQSTLNNYSQYKIRKMKSKPNKIDDFLTLAKEAKKNLILVNKSDNEIINDEKNKQQNADNPAQTSKTELNFQSILQQQRFGSYSDEITDFSKIQFQRVTKVKKYNTNLHGFNRFGARQLFIRTIIDVNPEFNINYDYNTGIGAHSEKENVISKVIQSTAKNMFGQEFELETSTNNPGLLEFKQNSNIFSQIPTQEQLKKVIFGDFNSDALIDMLENN